MSTCPPTLAPTLDRIRTLHQGDRRRMAGPKRSIAASRSIWPGRPDFGGRVTPSRVARVYTRLRSTDSPSAFYAAAAERIPRDIMLALGPGVWRELRQELRSVEAVGR